MVMLMLLILKEELHTGLADNMLISIVEFLMNCWHV